MPLAEFVIRLITAFFLGSILGLERQWRQRVSGLQTNATNALVAVGACLFVMIAAMTPSDSSPTRITAQIVSGIGFLGGGVILRDGLTVRGLNTAATLWCAAAIGALTGSGFTLEALAGTLTIILTNLLSQSSAHRNPPHMVTHKNSKINYSCHLTCAVNNEASARLLFIQAVENAQLSLNSLSSRLLEDNPDLIDIRAEVSSEGRNDILVEKIIGRLIEEVEVFSINWHITEE